ncbi:MAG: PfkB family carbohydrate kinase [Acidimicrobiales bacterium]
MVDPSLPSDRAAIEFDVVVLGSLNVDLVARTPRLPRPGETVIGSSFTQVAGGKGLNQAVAASRAGASVALVGAVGDDDAGVFLRQVVRAEGIDDRWLETVPGVPTGRALITVDDDAENVIVVVPGANAWEDDALGDDSPLPYGRVTLAQLEVPQSAVARGFASARAIGSITVLNPAPQRNYAGARRSL